MEEDSYLTISRASEGVCKDKGSKFIAYAYPILSEEDAKQLIVQVKAEHPKARHHCWALRLSPDVSWYRINDDGEPSGSAGRPILNVLLSLRVTNVLVVVVRYFGGTLLGVPGLIHAYKTATQEAMASTVIVEKTVDETLLLEFDYEKVNSVMKVVKDYSLQILSQSFDVRCSMQVVVRKKDADIVRHKIASFAIIH